MACTEATDQTFPKCGGWDGVKGMAGHILQPGQPEGAAWAAEDTASVARGHQEELPCRGDSALRWHCLHQVSCSQARHYLCSVTVLGAVTASLADLPKNAAPGRAAGAADSWIHQRHMCQALVLKARSRRWLWGQVFQQDLSPTPEEVLA